MFPTRKLAGTKQCRGIGPKSLYRQSAVTRALCVWEMTKLMRHYKGEMMLATALLGTLLACASAPTVPTKGNAGDTPRIATVARTGKPRLRLYVTPKMQLANPGTESASVQFLASFDDPSNSEGCPEFTLFVSCPGCTDRQKIASVQSDCAPTDQGHSSWGPRNLRLSSGTTDVIVEARTSRRTYLARETVRISGSEVESGPR